MSMSNTNTPQGALNALRTHLDLIGELIDPVAGQIALLIEKAVWGTWDDDPDFPPEDWRYEIANEDTRLGYHEWCAQQRELENEGADDDLTAAATNLNALAAALDALELALELGFEAADPDWTERARKGLLAKARSALADAYALLNIA